MRKPRKKKNSKKINSWETYKDTRGEIYMICANSEPDGETFDGKYWKGVQCHNFTRVADYTTAVVCHVCARKLVDPPILKSVVRKSDKPRGWHFMKEYVHKDGTVYHRGVEQPKLKDTLSPTVIIPKAKKKKLSRIEKLNLKTKLLIEFNTLTKVMLNTTKKTARAKVARKINKLQKQIKKL